MGRKQKGGLVLDIVIIAIAVSIVSLLIISQMSLNVKVLIEDYFRSSLLMVGERVANAVSILESVEYNATVKISLGDVFKIKPNLPYEICLSTQKNVGCVPLIMIENNKNVISSDEVVCGVLTIDKSVIADKQNIEIGCE